MDSCPRCEGVRHGIAEPCPNVPPFPSVELTRGPHPAGALALLGIAFALMQIVVAVRLLVACLGQGRP